MPTARELASTDTILEDLVQDLEGHLAAIAFCGGHADLADVERRISDMKKIYGLFMDGGFLPYGLNPAHDAINEAYDEFEILAEWGDPEYILERARYAFSCLNSPIEESNFERYDHLKPWLEEKKQDKDVEYYSEI